MSELIKKTIRHVLIIDDDEDDCALMAETLEEIDNKIKCVLIHDSKEAIASLTDSKALPEIIFLDLHMPKMSGLELLKLLKANPALMHIPVIVCTDSKLAREIDEGKMLGAADVIKKPASFFLMKFEMRKALKIIEDLMVSQARMQA